MKHPGRVEDYLEHIAEAIERATSYLQAIPNLAAFKENPQAQDAVIRNIEIIGEAVNKINSTAPDFIKQHPEFPWAQMRGMRNVAIHEYFFVDLEMEMPMNTVREIERAIDALNAKQMEELYAWLDQRYPQPIDPQLKADLDAGRIDDRIRRALDDHKAGNTHLLYRDRLHDSYLDSTPPHAA